MLNEEDLSKVGEEIERYRTHRFSRMRFAPSIEVLFRKESLGRRGKQLSVQGLIVLMVYDLLIFGDYLTDPSSLLRAFVIRFCLVTPLALVTVWLASGKLLARFREQAAAVLCCVACISMLRFQLANVPTAMHIEAGFFLVLMAMNTVLRIEFFYAVLTTAFCLVTALLFLLQDHLLSTPLKFSIAGAIFWSCMLSCYANYALTREHRLSWLQQRRNRIQSRMLAETNRELISLSTTDRLTGLPNRNAYEDTFSKLWAEGSTRRIPLSAVMVDVDHFKRINDSFGHCYGDRVLQRVANLLQQALREEGDFVGRYGGEEFVVLLPNSDTASAVRVAERIRTLVQVAGSPSVNRSDASPISSPLWATVSCGVATVLPTRGMEPRMLIELADAAMYRAKQNGRNQVCCSSVQYPPVSVHASADPAVVHTMPLAQKSA